MNPQESRDFTAKAIFEDRFWLQILGDHSRFIYTSLAPNETKEASRAANFIEVFDSLKEELVALGGLRDGSVGGSSSLTAFHRKAERAALDILEFKLHLLRRHLESHIGLRLPPTFLNHMVNENEEYIGLLRYLKDGQEPPVVHPLHHDQLWLSDAVGHADTIAQMVDPSEQSLIEQSREFSKQFQGFYLKAVEYAGYLRTAMKRFPALHRLHGEAVLEIHMFERFLEEIKELELDHRLLGALSPLMPDHMAREECYYVMKLAQTGEAKLPDCDPGRPRVES